MAAAVLGVGLVAPSLMVVAAGASTGPLAAATSTTSAPTTTTVPGATTTTSTSVPGGTTTPPNTTTTTVPTTTTVAPPGGLPAPWTEVGSPYVINPQLAAALFNSFWYLRQTALVEGSTASLKFIEAGPALKADDDNCGCGVVPWGPPLANSIFVTRQTSFPAYFMAEAFTHIPGDSTADAAVIVLVFQRLAADEAWKVVIDSQQQVFPTGPPAQEIDQPVVDAQGFDASSPFTFPGGSGALAGDLAAYWQYWADHGHAPAHSVFLPGYWTTQRGASIWANFHGRAANGLVYHYHWVSGPSKNAWTVPEDGYEIACGSIVDTATLTNPGGYVYQPPDRSQFPPELAPGEYKSVVWTSLESPCFYADPDGVVDAAFGAAPWSVSIVGVGKQK